MSLAYGKQTNELFIENLDAGTYDHTLQAVARTAEGITGAVADASIDPLHKRWRSPRIHPRINRCVEGLGFTLRK